MPLGAQVYVVGVRPVCPTCLSGVKPGHETLGRVPLKKNNKTTFLLHSLVCDMNLYKSIHMHSKLIKSNWSSTSGSGGRGKFTSAKKHSSDGKDLNNLITSVVA